MGNIRWVIDGNGVKTEYNYDSRGRLIQVVENADAPLLQKETTLLLNFKGEITQITDPSGYIQTNMFDDVHGWLDYIKNAKNEKIEFSYDINSNPDKVEILNSSSVVRKTDSAEYDYLSKLQNVYLPNGIDNTSYTYDEMNNIQTVTDPAGYYTTYVYDQLNRLEKIQLFDGTSTLETKYQYDDHNNIIKVIDANLEVYDFIYNDKGLLISENSSIRGIILYTYEPSGNIKTKTDALTNTTSFTYDVLNRLKTIDYLDDGTIDVTYTYDSNLPHGMGKLWKEVNANVTIEYQYDAFGRLILETQTFGGTSFATTYSYDQNDNVTSIIYPSGKKYLYTYDNVNQVTSIDWEIEPGNNKILVESITYEPYGGIKGISYGNSSYTAISYNNKYQIDFIGSTILGVIDQDYLYDSLGNIVEVIDNFDANNSFSYGYDNLYRLESASSVSYPENDIDFTYQMNGNRETKILDNTNTTTYNYINNKLTSLSGNEIATATYDANGNMTSWDQNSVLTDYKYDEANRLDTLVKPFNTQAYFYNSRHQRYKTENVGSTSSHFVYSASGLLLSEYRYTTSWEADYIYLNGMPIAKVMVHYDEPIESPPPGDTSGGIQSLSLEGFGTQALGEGPGGPIDPPPTIPTEDVFYIHNNYLGTPIAITNDAQTIKWSTQHYPFGAKYNENVSTTNYIRFLGQWEDNNTDLHYNWHRFYRPELGQYITPDPIGLAGGINMYSYVGGNPINYIDPWGLLRIKIKFLFFTVQGGSKNSVSFWDLKLSLLPTSLGATLDIDGGPPKHLELCDGEETAFATGAFSDVGAAASFWRWKVAKGTSSYDLTGFKTLTDGSTIGIGENGSKQAKYSVPYSTNEINARKFSIGAGWKFGWYIGGSFR